MMAKRADFVIFIVTEQVSFSIIMLVFESYINLGTCLTICLTTNSQKYEALEPMYFKPKTVNFSIVVVPKKVLDVVEPICP